MITDKRYMSTHDAVLIQRENKAFVTDTAVTLTP